jgi:methanethiol S-methyltransferase
MPGNHLILILLWSVYCILHSLMASSGFKQKLVSLLGTRFKYYRLFYTLFAFLFLVFILYYQFNIETSRAFESSYYTRLAGILVGISGLIIMITCIKKYFMSLSGLLSLVKETSYNTLIITGIHKYVRHPLYLGTFGFIWGAFLCYPFWTILIADTIITLYTLIAIRFEEAKLVKEYGKSYKEYQQRVPKLIPSFKPRQGRQP